MRRLITLLALCALPAPAVDWKSLKPEGYVSDFARVIDPQSRAELESYAARVEAATGAQMAFVTLPSLEGEPIEDVTNDIFHAWGIGKKGEDNGAMVLLSVGDRKSRLEVGGGLGGAPLQVRELQLQGLAQQPESRRGVGLLPSSGALPSSIPLGFLRSFRSLLLSSCALPSSIPLG